MIFGPWFNSEAVVLRESERSLTVHVLGIIALHSAGAGEASHCLSGPVFVGSVLRLCVGSCPQAQ